MLISISSSIPCTCLDYFVFDRDQDTFLLYLWTRKNFQKPLGRLLGVSSCRLIVGPTKEYIPTKIISHFSLLCMIGLSAKKKFYGSKIRRFQNQNILEFNLTFRFGFENANASNPRLFLPHPPEHPSLQQLVITKINMKYLNKKLIKFMFVHELKI